MQAARWFKGVLFCVTWFALAGCLATLPESASKPGAGGAGFLSGLKSAPDRGSNRPPLAKVRFVGGDVVVAGPSGYCIDPKTVQNRAERGFAIIASCKLLSGGRVGLDVEPVVITVAIGPRGGAGDVPSSDALAQSAGAAALHGETVSGLVLAQLDRGGNAYMPKGDARYWRAAFAQGDRLIGLALYAPKGSPLAGGDGGAFLRKQHALIQSLSPKQAARPAAEKKQANPPLAGVLGGLFNR